MHFYLFVYNLSPSNVKDMPDFGKNVQWPTPPPVLAQFIEYLKKIHNRLVIYFDLSLSLPSLKPSSSSFILSCLPS